MNSAPVCCRGVPPSVTDQSTGTTRTAPKNDDPQFAWACRSCGVRHMCLARYVYRYVSYLVFGAAWCDSVPHPHQPCAASRWRGHALRCARAGTFLPCISRRLSRASWLRVDGKYPLEVKPTAGRLGKREAIAHSGCRGGGPTIVQNRMSSTGGYRTSDRRPVPSLPRS
jgi:hypothetical protein